MPVTNRDVSSEILGELICCFSGNKYLLESAVVVDLLLKVLEDARLDHSCGAGHVGDVF